MARPRSAAHAALGQAIREMRSQRGLSQPGLSIRSGFDPSYISGLEAGRRNPSYSTLLRLAEALDVPLSQIIVRAHEIAR